MRCKSAFRLQGCAHVFLLLVGWSAAFGQRAGLNDPQNLNQVITSYTTAPGTGVLIFNVFAERTGASGPPGCCEAH